MTTPPQLPEPVAAAEAQSATPPEGSDEHVVLPATPEPAIECDPPILQFHPYAWIKLLFMLKHVDTEIGGLCICDKDNPLYVLDIAVVKQEVSKGKVDFNDAAVVEHMEAMSEDHHLSPEQTMRIWVHTHPGNSPRPSYTDEETFEKWYGRCPWAVMFILDQSMGIHCDLKIQYRAGDQNLVAHVDMDVRTDWLALQETDVSALKLPTKKWAQEIKDNVTTITYGAGYGYSQHGGYQQQQHFDYAGGTHWPVHGSMSFRDGVRKVYDVDLRKWLDGSSWLEANGHDTRVTAEQRRIIEHLVQTTAEGAGDSTGVPFAQGAPSPANSVVARSRRRKARKKEKALRRQSRGQ